jgi:hypothetical protein
MKTITVIFGLALVAFLVGCQGAKGPAYAQEPYMQAKPKDPNNALVYIYRTKQDYRAKSRSWPAVFLNEIAVGSLKYDGYLVAEVPPGEHLLSATGLSKASRGWDFADKEMKFSVESGHVRFFQLTAKYDPASNTMLGGRMEFMVYLTPMDHEDAKYDMYGLKLSD